MLFRSGGDGLLSKEFNQIFCKFSDEDLSNFGFCNTEVFKTIDKEYDLSKRAIKQIRTNCVTFAEDSNFHNDGFGPTVLYYANLEWMPYWSGHTLFLNETLDEAEYTCLYKPGRVVVFDGSIPHLILTPNTMCRTPRLTFVIQYTDIVAN